MARASRILYLDFKLCTFSWSIEDPNLEELLSDWEFYYNWHRPNSSLDGKTPQEKHVELLYKTPFWEDVGKMFDSKKRTYRFSQLPDSFSR
jgi:hypothetical protein